MALNEATSSKLTDAEFKQEIKRLANKLLLCLPNSINFTIDEVIMSCDLLTENEKGLAAEALVQIQNLLFHQEYIKYCEPNNTYQLFVTEKLITLKKADIQKHLILQTLNINNYQTLDSIAQYLKSGNNKILVLLSDLKEFGEVYIKETPTFNGSHYIINIELKGIASYENEKYLRMPEYNEPAIDAYMKVQADHLVKVSRIDNPYNAQELQKKIEQFLKQFYSPGDKIKFLNYYKFLMDGIFADHQKKCTEKDDCVYTITNRAMTFYVNQELNKINGQVNSGLNFKETFDTSIHYVNSSRLQELKDLPTNTFDFSKLIKLCDELNDNYSRKNFLSVGMIGRTILHHIPPVFGLKTFEEVANNYGGATDNKSFKKSMTHLNNSLKNIADSYLHLQIRNREILPNETQVDFRQDLDLLLAEIVRIFK